MLSVKIKEYLNEYISQEVYVQVAVAKGKNKISTNAAISKYFESNHFQGLAEGKPHNTFLDDLKDKCLGKLVSSPMKHSKTEDMKATLGKYMWSSCKSCHSKFRAEH